MKWAFENAPLEMRIPPDHWRYRSGLRRRRAKKIHVRPIKNEILGPVSLGSIWRSGTSASDCVTAAQHQTVLAQFAEARVDYLHDCLVPRPCLHRRLFGAKSASSGRF